MEYLLNEDEMDKLLILKQITTHTITQEEAGAQLGLSSRQIRRLLRRIEQEGCAGIKRRPSGGNRSYM